MAIKKDDQIKEFKESYEKPKITTYSEEDILSQYEVVGGSMFNHNGKKFMWNGGGGS